MAMALPDGRSLPQQDNASRHMAKTAQKHLDECDKESKMLPWPPNSPHPCLIEHLWVTPEQGKSIEAPPSNQQDPKDPLLMSQCQTAQDTTGLRGPDRSDLF